MECTLHTCHVRLHVRMWCPLTQMHNTCHQAECDIYMQIEPAHIGAVPASQPASLLCTCMRDTCSMNACKPRLRAEYKTKSDLSGASRLLWHRGTRRLRNSSHAAELAKAGSFPSRYIRYTRRKANGGKEGRRKGHEEGRRRSQNGREKVLFGIRRRGVEKK